MSEYQPHHVVTVTTTLEDEGTPDERRYVERVVFACSAEPDAECRTYPDCECESWLWSDDGKSDIHDHPRIAGRQCWMTDWFENEGAVYEGSDFDDMRDDCVPAVDRSGPIVFTGFFDYPTWRFAEDADLAMGAR